MVEFGSMLISAAPSSPSLMLNHDVCDVIEEAFAVSLKSPTPPGDNPLAFVCGRGATMQPQAHVNSGFVE